jgi:hypothetical protein
MFVICWLGWAGSADVNLFTHLGWAPAHLAAMLGREDVLDILVEKVRHSVTTLRPTLVPSVPSVPSVTSVTSVTSSDENDVELEDSILNSIVYRQCFR